MNQFPNQPPASPDDDLQARFRALGVFAPETRLTSDVAAAVWDETETEARALLQALAQAGLLEQHDADTFTLGSAAQAEAQHLLQASEDWPAVRRRHRAHYAAVAKRESGSAQLRRHLPNLALAYETAIADADAALAAEIVWFTEDALATQGREEQRERWLRDTLDLIAQHTGDLRLRQAQLRGTLANILLQRNDVDGADTLLRQALAGFQSVGDAHSAAVTQTRLAELAAQRGAPAEAQALLQDALDTFRQLGDASGVGYVSDVLSSLTGQAARAAAPVVTPPAATDNLDDSDIDKLMSGLAQAGGFDRQPVRIDASQMLTGNPPPLPDAADVLADDELTAQILTSLESASKSEYGGVPGEFFELRLPLIIDAYRRGGEDAVREHVRSQGMPEEVVEQVIRDLPMLLSEADSL